MLEGLKRQKTHTDSREPITPSILLQLLDLLPHVCRSQFESLLFAAAFSLAHFCLLRISEFATRNKKAESEVLQFQDVILDAERISVYCKKIKNKPIRHWNGSRYRNKRQ